LKEGLSAEALAKEGDVVELGGLKLKIIETPGHSEDSICVVCEKEGIIFTGDTLFKSGIGRTDLEGGDYGQIQKSLKRLMQYPDHYKIYPGHGPDSTIGKEKLHLRF